MTDHSPTLTATLKLSIAGRPIEAQIEVPAGPTRPRDLLPILQGLTDEVVELACDRTSAEGKTISCRAGCGACCRQAVPISQAEAFDIADLVERLPEPRRGEVRRRFRAAEERLAAAGLLEKFSGSPAAADEDPVWLGLAYFRLGIACPFLEEESCSIHPERPLACREYLVTSPAENCRQPTAETIARVPLPAKVSQILLRLERGETADDAAKMPLTLTLALRWAATHPEPPPQGTGPELISELLRGLSGRELPAAPEPERRPSADLAAIGPLRSGVPADADGGPPEAAQKTRTGEILRPWGGLPRPSEANDGLGRPPHGALSDSISASAPTAACTPSQAAAQAYDELPYHSYSYAFTHPSALATVATLHGMTPPAVERCRVLELGCASGGNLIPMAFGLPEGRFVGLDVSPRQVGDGRRHIERLGLNNVELRVMDLVDVDRSFGEFDYILCHGVLSWVPRPVQDKILSICSRNLAPQGVALVSYNTYPFWRLRGMLREVLLYHIDAAAPARERVRQGRQFLEFLAANCPASESVYVSALKEELLRWQRHDDNYLRHDQLGEINEPFYFHEFAARAGNCRLQYLGDARLWDRSAVLSDDARRQLRAYRGDVARYEQHLDFVCEGGFRRSLLCHDRIRLDRPPRPESLDGMWLSAGAEPASGKSSVDRSSAAEFRSRDGVRFSTDAPWLRAALGVLSEHWPLQFTFDELCRQARRVLGDAPEARLDPWADPALLRLPLLECGSKQLVELSVHRWPTPAKPGDRPRATALARLQAETGPLLTTRRHELIEARELDRQILLRLDGQRSQAELIQSVAALLESGEFALTAPEAEELVADVPDLPSLIKEALGRFATLGLLDG